MRHIKKTSCAAVEKWKGAEKNSPQNLIFDNMPKDEIIKNLLKEQRALCAYTMQRITESSCHIEHVIPQNRDRAKAIEYNNMVACTPKDGGAKIGYGAPHKGGTLIQPAINFISPLSSECESHFKYTNNGEILPRIDNDFPAQSTIDILNLKEGTLINKRQRALEAHGLISLRQASKSSRKPNNPASRKEAETLAITACNINTHKELPEFCVMLRQIAQEYAERKTQKSKRLRQEGNA